MLVEKPADKSPLALAVTIANIDSTVQLKMACHENLCFREVPKSFMNLPGLMLHNACSTSYCLIALVHELCMWPKKILDLITLIFMLSKRQRLAIGPAYDNPAQQVLKSEKKRAKLGNDIARSSSSGWTWSSGGQVSPTHENRIYYSSLTFLPSDTSCIPLHISVEDLVATEVNKEEEETKELNLKYWVGQVAALFEDESGDKQCVIRFFDTEKQWRYMNSDDGRLMRAFGESFRRFEILETDVCEINPVEIIVKKLNWRSTEAECKIDNKGLELSEIPNSFFSDRMIVRCGSDGKRRADLSDSLWPAPLARRRQRLLIQCEESKYCLELEKKKDSLLVAKPSVVKKDFCLDGAHERAVNALKLSVLPENLPCRETETACIREFIRKSVKATGSSGNVLYISGVPGTGKTASVLSVVNQMQKQAGEAKFEFAYINSMKLNSPSDLYVDLMQKLGIHKRRFRADKPQEKLTDFFSSCDKKRPVTLLLVDEIDYLVTKSQAVVYQLFDWPLLLESKLVLLTISNTMDLPERLMPRVASRLGLARLNYLPYNHEQIRTVVQERLEEAKALSIFSEDAIKFVSRRVATSSGDIRKALHICRRAIELREGAVIQASDVHRAQFDLYSNPFVAVISHLPYLSRMILISLVLETKFNNTDSVTLRALHGRFANLVKTNPPCSPLRSFFYSDFLRVVDDLRRLAIVAVSKQSTASQAANNSTVDVFTPEEEGLQDTTLVGKTKSKKGADERKCKVIAKDNGAEEDENGSGYLIGLNALIENNDVKNALVNEAGDKVAQRLLN